MSLILFQGFQLDFYVHIETAAPRLVGTSHLLPLENDVSFLIKKVPIIGLNHKPIGEVTGNVYRVTSYLHLLAKMTFLFA